MCAHLSCHKWLEKGSHRQDCGLQKGVNKERIAKAFPYGKVEVKIVGGGLRWHSGIVAPKLGQCSYRQPCSALIE